MCRNLFKVHFWKKILGFYLKGREDPTLFQIFTAHPTVQYLVWPEVKLVYEELAVNLEASATSHPDPTN